MFVYFNLSYYYPYNPICVICSKKKRILIVLKKIYVLRCFDILSLLIIFRNQLSWINKIYDWEILVPYQVDMPRTYISWRPWNFRIRKRATHGKEKIMPAKLLSAHRWRTTSYLSFLLGSSAQIFLVHPSIIREIPRCRLGSGRPHTHWNSRKRAWYEWCNSLKAHGKLSWRRRVY